MNPVLLRCANLWRRKYFLRKVGSILCICHKGMTIYGRRNKTLIAHLGRRTRAAPTVSKEELHKFRLISASDSNSAISELVRSSFCNAERLLI